MVTIRIGNDSRRLEDAEESWITQQVNDGRRDGLTVCVEVMINTGAVNVRLATQACGPGGGVVVRLDPTRQRSSSCGASSGWDRTTSLGATSLPSSSSYAVSC